MRSVEEALQLVRDAPELAVIGGAEIYRTILPIADRIYLTRVEADVVGDTLFPVLDVDAVERSTDRRRIQPTSAISIRDLLFDGHARYNRAC